MIEKYFFPVLYFLLLFFIGLLASGKIKNLADYFAGGKKLNFWVVAFSSRATGSSAWVLLGLTGMGAVFGLHAFWVVLGTTSGVVISWFFMAGRFKKLSDRYNALTIPDFLEAHFNDGSGLLRLVSALVLSVFVTIYVSAQIDATGTAFETFLGWNYLTGAITGFVLVVLYMFAGGFVAVAWSDVFQGFVMLAGLLLLPLAGWFAFGTGNSVAQGLRQIDPALLSIWGEGGFTLPNLMRTLSFLMIGLGYLGSPQLYVRFISIKDEKELAKGKWLSAGLQLFMNTAAVSTGIFGRLLLTSPGQPLEAVLGTAGQDVLIKLAGELLPVAVSGLYVAAVLAAIMSTIDSLLILASSAVAYDFYQQRRGSNLSQRQLVNISRVVTLLLALLALAVAVSIALLVPGRTIFWFVIFGWSGLAASFCPVIILSLFWKNFNRNGALATIITGFLSVPFYKFIAVDFPVVGPYFATLAELLPSFLTAMLAGWLVTRLTQRAGKPYSVVGGR